MPSPRPSEESKDEWMERCMSDDEAMSDFPEQDQRAAFCNSEWDDAVSKSNEQEGAMSFFDSLMPDFLKGDDVEKRHGRGRMVEDLTELGDEQLMARFATTSAAIEKIINTGTRMARELNNRGADLPNNRLAKIVRTFSGGTIKSTEEPDGDDGEEESIEEHLPEGVNKSAVVPPTGPQKAKVAFVGAYPSRLDSLRNEHFTGPVGKTLKDTYLEKLDISREESLRLNLVPVHKEEYAEDPNRPTDEEVEQWDDYLKAELDRLEPQHVVALGKRARDVLGDAADEWMPHPRAVNIYGESDEIARKAERLKKSVDQADPVQKSGIDEDSIEFDMIAKSDERQVVYGTPLVPEKEDADGNWTTEDEIGKAIDFYMMNHVHKTDHEHVRDFENDVFVVESFQTPTDMTLPNGNNVKKGSWIVGVKIQDPERWNMVKSGNYRGFSFEGKAKIRPDKRLSE